ncbi:MAG: hypothetical protein ABL983_01850 [Nitrospira sp.]
MIDGLTDPHKDGGLYHRPYGATRMRKDARQETGQLTEAVVSRRIFEQG